MKNQNAKDIQVNLDLMDKMRLYNDDSGFVIIYIVDENRKKTENLADSYYIDENSKKVSNLWEAKVFRTEESAIFESRNVSFGDKVTSTVISPVSIFAFDAIEKLKEKNIKILNSIK